MSRADLVGKSFVIDPGSPFAPGARIVPTFTVDFKGAGLELAVQRIYDQINTDILALYGPKPKIKEKIH